MTINWIPVRRMIEAVRPRLVREASRLRGAIERSNDRLAPLTDPLLADFGTHRWLSSEREEAYSDWLEWIVRQLETPDCVFSLFEIEGPKNADRYAGAPLSLSRELPILHGHADRAGRLDVLIRYGGRALVCIEVKLGPADAADTEKQLGYRKYLDEQTDIPTENRHAVLLVTEASQAEYPGRFKAIMWSAICIRLRRFVPMVIERRGVSVAAMVLAFVGAIEQNVLRFSGALVRQAVERQPVLLSSEISDHILESLQRGDMNGARARIPRS